MYIDSLNRCNVNEKKKKTSENESDVYSKYKLFNWNYLI